ncbi:MAG: ParA family protein [Geminicoccaceae bacterium]|nr:ParA family protein [Geminicoccaceae bacterium]
MQIFRRRIKGAPKIIVVGNLKGGTGKSTVAVNTACALGDMGHRTVVVDTDPQKSATLWSSGGQLPVGVAEFPLRDLNAAGEWIEELDVLRTGYARLVIDLPAVVSPVLASAFLVADVILIPSSPSQVDVQATRRTLKFVAQTRRERGANPPHVLIVPSQVRRGWFDDGGVKQQLTSLSEDMTPPVRHDKRFGEAFQARQWIGDVAPGSRAHRDIVAVSRDIEARMAPVRGTAPRIEPSPVTA